MARSALILVPLVVGMGTAGSASMGAAALKGDQHFKYLSQQTHQVLSELQNANKG